jgi:hypothetical protein
MAKTPKITVCEIGSALRATVRKIKHMKFGEKMRQKHGI